MFQYAYLIFSLFLLGIWFILYFFKTTFRREMFLVSLATSFLGLTEPFFVPEYWSPPTLFNLALRTGFDLESLIFCFAVGGIVAVIYEAIFKVRHMAMSVSERQHFRHRFHFWVIISAPLVFFILFFTTNFNPIYSAALGLVVAFFATWYCRPDLVKKMLVSGLLFSVIYFFTFLLLNLTFPGYTEAVWNLKAVSGILLVGVPLEELIWAFTFGLYWSSIYEHFGWYKLKIINNLT